jgi:hypothetical protein
MKRNYKQELEELKNKAKKDGLKVNMRYADKKWRGMNPAAAKELKEKCPPKTICVNHYSETNNKKRSQTLRHELVEYNLMKNGYHYPSAHRHANNKQRG